MFKESWVRGAAKDALKGKPDVSIGGVSLFSFLGEDFEKNGKTIKGGPMILAELSHPTENEKRYQLFSVSNWDVFRHNLSALSSCFGKLNAAMDAKRNEAKIKARKQAETMIGAGLALASVKSALISEYDTLSMADIDAACVVEPKT